MARRFSIIREFQEFIARGNVMELAVGIIIGAAFTSIVNSLVENVLTPILGLFLGGIDFSSISFGLGEARIGIGAFIQAVVDFLIVAWVVFLIVRTYNGFMKRFERTPEEPPAKPREEVLLEEIRDLLALQARNQG